MELLIEWNSYSRNRAHHHGPPDIIVTEQQEDRKHLPQCVPVPFCREWHFKKSQLFSVDGSLVPVIANVTSYTDIR